MTVDTATLSNAALVIITLLGMYTAAFWLALIFWTYRDHRARSRDSLASLAAALLVAVLFLPGLVIYLLLRPKETLTEAYERSLEEEALLQSIEEKPICPGCSRPTDREWHVCPHCHTTLRKSCVKCGRMLELAWTQCPYCATAQPVAAEAASGVAGRYPSASRTPVANPGSYREPAEPSLEFVDTDPYRG